MTEQEKGAGENTPAGKGRRRLIAAVLAVAIIAAACWAVYAYYVRVSWKVSLPASADKATTVVCAVRWGGYGGMSEALVCWSEGDHSFAATRIYVEHFDGLAGRIAVSVDEGEPVDNATVERIVTAATALQKRFICYTRVIDAAEYHAYVKRDGRVTQFDTFDADDKAVAALCDASPLLWRSVGPRPEGMGQGSETAE